MRKKIITKQMIQEAAISCVAQNGLEHFTTKKASDMIGISEGSIFNNYPNKTALLTACLYFIDKQIDDLLKAVPTQTTDISEYIHDLWYVYFRYLVAHADYTKFYYQFRHSSYYTQEVISGQKETFLFFSKFLHSNMHLFKVNPDLFWTYMIDTTMNFAIFFSQGSMEPTEDYVASVYKLIINGINGVYHPDQSYPQK